MPLVMVKEDSAYRCTDCGNVLSLKKGQLLPPCPRCGGEMEKHSQEGSLQEPPCCK